MKPRIVKESRLEKRAANSLKIAKKNKANNSTNKKASDQTGQYRAHTQSLISFYASRTSLTLCHVRYIYCVAVDRRNKRKKKSSKKSVFVVIVLFIYPITHMCTALAYSIADAIIVQFARDFAKRASNHWTLSMFSRSHVARAAIATMTPATAKTTIRPNHNIWVRIVYIVFFIPF